jgi:hypothetical protein
MFEAHRNMQTRFPMSGILERKAYYQTIMVWSCCVFQRRASKPECLRDDLETHTENTYGLEGLRIRSKSVHGTWICGPIGWR